MKKFIIAAALVLIAAPAFAADTVTTTNCKRNYIGSGTSCQTIVSEPDALPPPRPLTNAERKAERAYYAALEAERSARVEKWENFCKPVIVQDKEGINRYTYAHKNCDIGRSQ